jgi:hypothetical protein
VQSLANGSMAGRPSGIWRRFSRAARPTICGQHAYRGLGGDNRSARTTRLPGSLLAQEKR